METASRPRIVIVSSTLPPDHSGAGLAALKVADRLERRGMLAFLLTATELPDSDWDIGSDALMRLLRERTCRAGKRERREKTSHWRAILGNTRRCFQTLRNLVRRRKEYDIVHCFSPTWLSLFAVLAAKCLKKKVIIEITLAGGDCPESVGSTRFRILHQRRVIQFRLADAIVCISPLLGTICRRAGFSEKKVFVVPRAVDLERFHPVEPEQKLSLRNRLGLPTEQKLILFVGGIIPRKGIDLLLPAFRALVVGNSEVGLVIVGPAHKSSEAQRWHEEILRLQQEPELQGRLFYPGWQMNVDEYMQAADVFAVPSRREGFGNVFIEAMASGLPVVCLRIDGITTYIVESPAVGRIVEESSAALLESLQQVLEEVRSHPEEIRQATREAVKMRFSHARIDHLYEEIYDKLLEGRPHGEKREIETALSAEGKPAWRDN